jgi:hypothetical protein
MAEENRRSVRRLTDPKALRALAHPLRLSLIGLLRRDGPLTATRAGELLGESSGSCSFHLRQLAKYGLVEPALGGRGRERPWQATTMFTSIPDDAAEPELAAAADLVLPIVADRYFDALLRWLETASSEPPSWRHAAHFGDTLIYVTAEELEELAEQEKALVDQFLDRLEHPERRPPGARAVTYLHLAFPGDLSGARPAGAQPSGAQPGGAQLADAQPEGGTGAEEPR